MHKLLSKLWERHAKFGKADKGFTLIELLVVVVILGVLIAIAIPLYLNYRKGANDAAAESDLKNAINVMELCNADNSQYPTYSGGTALGPGGAVTVADTNTKGCTRTISLSAGTSLTYLGTTVSYKITDSNSSGTSGRSYCYDSSKGGPVVAGAC